MTNLVFLAISRTGPDPMRHEVVEIAAIVRRPGTGDLTAHWHIRPEHLEAADDAELRRNRYLERREVWEHNGEPVVAIDPVLGTTSPTSRRAVASRLAGAFLDSFVVTLGHDRELEFVREFLRRNGHPCPVLAHVDVTSFAAGALHGYAQGWAARHDIATSDDSRCARIPLDAVDEMPYSSGRVAQSMGLHLPDHPECALARARLAGALWSAASARPGPPPPPPAPPAETADELVAAGTPAEADDRPAEPDMPAQPGDLALSTPEP